MAVSPDGLSIFGTSISLQSATGGTLSVTANQSPITFTMDRQPGEAVTLRLAGATDGIGPPVSTWVYVVALSDSLDHGGNADSANVLRQWGPFEVANGTDVALSSWTPPASGFFRVAVMVGDSNNNARNMGNVAAGAANTQYHFDTDGNSAQGTLNTVSVTTASRVDMAVRVGCNINSIVWQTENAKYGDLTGFTVTFNQTFMSPRRMRLAISDGTTSNPTRQETLDANPSTGGVISMTGRRVDTTFAASPTAHYAHVSVGDSLGAVSDANMWPLLFVTAGRPSGVATTNAAWTFFTTSGHNVPVTSPKPPWHYRTNSPTNIGSGISLAKPSNGAPGVDVHDDAGRTNPSRLFRRPASDGDATHARPYLSATLLDAYGNPLPSTNVRVQVRPSGLGTNENSQDKTSSGAGLVTWDYAVGRTHPAFNRSKKSGADDPLSPPFTVAKADVHLADPDPVSNPGYVGPTFGGPYPAYAKDVWVQGRAWSGAEEPTATHAAQFGLSSEGLVESIWTSGNTTTGPSAEGGDDEPIVVGGRGRNLGTGPMNFKTSSAVNEGSGTVIGPPRNVIRDVAGRPLPTTPVANEWRQSATTWNITRALLDTGTQDLGNNQRLAGTYGYPDQFGDVSAPDRPSELALVLAFWDQNTAISGWSLTSLSDYGWTSDPGGNYGHRQVNIAFIAVDPNLNFIITADTVATHPDSTIGITAEMIRLLPVDTASFNPQTTPTHANVEPDGAPLFLVTRRDPATGQTVIHDKALGQALAGPGGEFLWTYVLDPGGVAGTFGVLVTGQASGSRPPDAGDIAIFTGAVNPAVDVVVDIHNLTTDDGHLRPLDQFNATAFATNDDTGLLETVDDAEVALVRDDGVSVVQTFNGTAWVTVGGGQDVVFHQMTQSGDMWLSPTWQVPSGDTGDIVANVRARISGVTYFGELAREVVGPHNGHRDGVVPQLLHFSLTDDRHPQVGDLAAFTFGLQDPAADYAVLDAAPTLKLLRLRGGAFTFLDSDLTWQPFVDLASSYAHPMPLNVEGTIGTFTVNDTSGWEAGQHLAFAFAARSEAEFSATISFDIYGADGKNAHDSYKPDIGSLLGLPLPGK